MSVIDQKVSELPPLGNRYDTDPALKQVIGALPAAAKQWCEPVLRQMGDIAGDQAVKLADKANKSTPTLKPFDKMGNRVDDVEFDASYVRLRELSYGAGIIGHYYEPETRRILGDNIEVAKFAHGYLFCQAEQGLYCPICMTDGVAFLVETYGTREQKQEFMPHLTSRQIDRLWEGGMFLTEKAGGSDVGATETIAKPLGDGRYALFGKKWFCSNASAEAVAVLARVDDKPGTRGLGLFLMRRHKEDGTLNNLTLDRLKDKLGTRSMPTGEITLDGAIAEPLGDLSRGFVQMADMLNLSRLYNANASVGVMRSVLVEALRYTNTRHTFGKPLNSYPLVQDKLIEVAVALEGSFHALFTAHGLRGKVLNHTASDEQKQLLRILTPLLKYNTAALSVRCASECLELHGGNGYIEDWPLARMLRDAQVLPVWEGTTNMMVLDTVRAMVKDNCHEALFAFAEKHSAQPLIKQALQELKNQTPNVLKQGTSASLDLSSKLWCDRAFQLVQACALVAAAKNERGNAVCEQFVLRHYAGDPTDFIKQTQRDFSTMLAAATEPAVSLSAQ